VDVDDRRRQHVDDVPVCDEAAHELTGGDHRTAERARRSPHRRCKENPELAVGHGERLVEPPLETGRRPR